MSSFFTNRKTETFAAKHYSTRPQSKQKPLNVIQTLQRAPTYNGNAAKPRDMSQRFILDMPTLNILYLYLGILHLKKGKSF